ncbi:helix-turn-helix transcriptional regulator [Rhodococcus sp. (in: high G+C Gram-positive bacteria)]|uniref:helix-turn-helix domain-containing protein n=1 Tax=Rhodococcus TaxID=1827 RepID=UPI0018A2F9A8|nr:helix-turn-helix domain-containing protein [Rhodococcus erythropolis]QXW02119.1 helix-turn-helix domain-containing protein [Rhodococcus globerulus]
MTDREHSLIEEYEATDAGSQGLAAADLAAQVVRLLSAAIEISPLDQRRLAEKIGVTEQRVSQVVNGDGNLRIAALARYLRALGYETAISATPVEEGLPRLPRKRSGRSRRVVVAESTVESSRWIDDSIVRADGAIYLDQEPHLMQGSLSKWQTTRGFPARQRTYENIVRTTTRVGLRGK